MQSNHHSTGHSSVPGYIPSLEELNRYFFHAPVAIAIVTGIEYRFTVANQRYLDVVGMRREDIMDRPAFEVMPELESSLQPVLAEVMRTGERYQTNEFRLDRILPGKASPEYFNFV